MRDHYGEFTARGLDIVAIGMGTPAMAADFRDKFSIPFRLLVDQEQETYKALEMKRGTMMDVVGPKVWLGAAKNALKGHFSSVTGLDVQQMGGVALVTQDGKLAYIHRAGNAPDNIPAEKLLERAAEL